MIKTNNRDQSQNQNKITGRSLHKYSGGCHCGNISLEMEITGKLDSYNPRACDCSFCRKHAASYISDPNGKLLIVVKDDEKLNRYRQGSAIVDCLICGICGVLLGISYDEDGCLFATVNSKVFECDAGFGREIMVSIETLDDQEKIQRWKNNWFSAVSIKKSGA